MRPLSKLFFLLFYLFFGKETSTFAHLLVGEEEEEEHESAVEMWKCGGDFVRRLRVDGVDYRWSYSSYARTHPREQVAKGRN
jgi:hypothetical protein